MNDATSSHPFITFTITLGSKANSTVTASSAHGGEAMIRSINSEWTSSIYEDETNDTISLPAATAISDELNLTCTIGTASLTYTISQYDAYTIPSWISIDSSTGVLSGTSPTPASAKTFKFYVDSAWTDSPAPPGTVQKVVTVNVEAYVEPETETEEIPDKRSSSDAAALFAQIAVGIIAVLSLVNFFVARCPFIPLWSIFEQLQFIIVILLIDSFTPKDIDHYLKHTRFALFNFTFLPIRDIPGIDDAFVTWMNDDQPRMKLETIEFDYRSTFVNNLSLIFVFLVLLIVHMLLRVMLCCKKDPEEDNFRNFHNFLKWLRIQTIDLIFYVLYLRILIEAYVSIVLTCTSEIYEATSSDDGDIISLTIA